MIWQPHISSNGQWIAAKILQGLFGAPLESIAEVTVSDMVGVNVVKRTFEATLMPIIVLVFHA